MPATSPRGAFEDEGTVVTLDQFRRKPSSPSAVLEAPSRPAAKYVAIDHLVVSMTADDSIGSVQRPTPQRRSESLDIYPLRDEDPVLVISTRLLREALALLDESLVSDENLLAADDAVLRMRAILPELFCCRHRLGESFGTVILGVFYSLANLNGVAPSNAQVAAVRNALARLLKEPFMSYDAALDIHESLEDVGLDPDVHAAIELATQLEEAIAE